MRVRLISFFLSLSLLCLIARGGKGREEREERAMMGSVGWSLNDPLYPEQWPWHQRSNAGIKVEVLSLSLFLFLSFSSFSLSLFSFSLLFLSFYSGLALSLNDPLYPEQWPWHQRSNAGIKVESLSHLSFLSLSLSSISSLLSLCILWTRSSLFIQCNSLGIRGR